ncbi:MFS transporter [Roseimaritima ulvae]|uniref:Putative sulfoacetate transporter SauU n=1 Tax=Roseimaritima ulvae TaxID=980254 RepID=A0A5B9QVY6_9BACT|nr:MFS transporter [Roseimaritima ulvae]QEG38171.1 putative sulfoacetate transporter SauU [Roseimaritima ulvae]
MNTKPYQPPGAAPAQRPTWIRHEVLALLTVAATLAYLTRNAVSVGESTIREDLGLTIRQSGWFMAAFFWSYAALQVPSGAMAHRRGTRFAMVAFACAWSVAAVCIGIAPGLWLLIVAQLLMGAAQAGLFPASCDAISRWTPLGRRTLACGTMAVGMQVGAIAASMTTGALMDALHWRWVFVLFAVPGFLWSAVFLMRFRNHPTEDAKVNEAELQIIRSERTSPNTPGAAEPTPWGLIFRSSALWFLCGQQICRASGYMFFASWFPTFLQQTRGVSVTDSGYLQALVFTGTLTGSLFGGLLTDWIWQRTKSLRLSRSGVGASFLFGCAVLILLAWFVESTFLAVAFLSIGSMLAAMAGPCAFAATIDIGGDHVPQVYGIMNMCGNFAAAACPILIAEIFEWTSNWTIVLLLFAAIYLFGAICWAMVDGRRRISEGG